MTQLSLFDIATGSAIPSMLPASANAETPPQAKSQDTLLALAALIREGRDQIEAQNQQRHREVQSIGELAQAVLRRHDLVAARRAAADARAQKHPTVDSDVHVAS